MLPGLFRGLTDILYPKICPACKKKLNQPTIDNLICRQCWQKIKKNLPPFCASCGRHLDKKGFAKNICPVCLKNRLHFDRAFAPCIYDGVIKDLIHEFKYKNKEHLGTPLSEIMSSFIKEYNLPINYLDFIIPIPLHKVRMREREFNQAQVLSGHLALEFNKPLLKDTLRRLRHTETQTELNLNQRLLNVKGSFQVTGDNCIKGKNILLVDDVLTTGATSSEAALALKNSGANIVFVLTLAN